MPSLNAFAKSLDLKFPLLSDFPNHVCCQAYGTYTERGVSRRITYVIDKEGVIRSEIVSDQDMARHSQDALRVVQELEGLTAKD